MSKYILRMHIDSKGRKPFIEWLRALKDVQSRNRIRARLDRLELGNLGDTKDVGQGVKELRFHFGPGIRVYFGIHEKQIILLLCGGDKRSQKKDIKKAQLYWEEFRRQL